MYIRNSLHVRTGQAWNTNIIQTSHCMFMWPCRHNVNVWRVLAGLVLETGGFWTCAIFVETRFCLIAQHKHGYASEALFCFFTIIILTCLYEEEVDWACLLFSVSTYFSRTTVQRICKCHVTPPAPIPKVWIHTCCTTKDFISICANPNSFAFGCVSLLWGIFLLLVLSIDLCYHKLQGRWAVCLHASYLSGCSTTTW